MDILITGAKGFVGKNLVATLKNIREGKDASYSLHKDLNILEYVRQELAAWKKEA